MLKIFRYLKKNIGTIFLLICLLIVQAMCDLSLPTYTSKIINVGVQQQGIENPVPKVIRKSTMEELSLFLDEKDYQKILSHYRLLSLNDKDYVKDYPILKQERVYHLEEDFQNKELEKALLVHYMLTSDAEESKKIQENLKKNIPAIFQSLSFIDILKQLPLEERQNIREKINEQFKEMPDTIVSSSAVTAIANEYEKIGINLDNMQTSYILIAGLKMLGLALFSCFATVLVSLLGSRVAASLAMRLREAEFKKILSFSKAEYKKYGIASLITRNTNDIQQVQMMMVMMLRMVFYAPIIALGGLFRVLSTAPSMTYIIGLGIVCVMTIVVTLFTFVMPKFKKLQKLVDRLNQVSREIVTGIPVIRAFSNQEYEKKRFEEANNNLKKTHLFIDRTMSIMMPTMMFVMNAICIFIVWKGSHAIDEGIIQVGDMLAFIQYTMQIIMSFLMISMFSIIFPRANVSANRIMEVLEEKNSVVDPKNPKEFGRRIKGLVEFKNVSFRYPDSDEDVLTDITFTAKQGTTTAFIGSTGSGKSTLINLIPRIYDVTKGELLVDGINVKDVLQKDLHAKIGYVPQKGILFSGTIESNIKFGNEEMSDNDMVLASQIAQAEEFIESKKKKYKSPISQGGTNVSGGQKQRLSIARAIAIHPEIYIFDDSFSALDFKTDYVLRQALYEHTKDATIFIVAQRINTILHADQIVVLDEGKMVGIGTHKELLKTCSVYREIAESQLSKEELENA